MKTTKMDDIPEGAIFCAEHGTPAFRHVDWFKVAKKSKTMVTLVPIAGKTVRKTGHNSSLVEANPGVEFPENTVKKKVQFAQDLATVKLDEGVVAVRRAPGHQARRGAQ